MFSFLRDIVFSRKIILSISYLLGIVFLVSGITKSFGIQNFSDEIAQYMDYYLNIPSIIIYRKTLAISICLLELFIGILSFIKTRNMSLSVVTTLLLLIFVYFTGRNYCFASEGYGIASCGCFGDLITLSPKWSFVKSSFLLSVSSFKLLMCCYINKQLHKDCNVL